ncbi:hypothetical protein QF000_000485 [Paraburkholderia atlantica]|uniref:Uncharacterized protein n=2 Tax=Paraburkholderia TaxID=1822464 RepID=A0A7W8LES3_9BURK|nr:MULTISPECIES: hypothetical protein [Paraburkholderia]MBB5404411.1 hypothetical protein [Paraburkholderia youngii]MBB5421585.1 hypothetical protein [Paraburkholderia atlantica]MBB5429496.1 hypothetical protein [Paraburkholderia atlantica]MPW11442.1 hypothetical protein [Paraburkholderia atlantica]NUY36053.1 hypothetical protein [Paraburkholderia atlantica]
MTNDVIVDLEKAQLAAKSLKANPPSASAISVDPKAYLAQCGIQISDKVEAMIRSKPVAVASKPRHAAIIHIDV